MSTMASVKIQLKDSLKKTLDQIDALDQKDSNLDNELILEALQSLILCIKEYEKQIKDSVQNIDVVSTDDKEMTHSRDVDMETGCCCSCHKPSLQDQAVQTGMTESIDNIEERRQAEVHSNCDSPDIDWQTPKADESLIQIKASNSEIERRISAFIEKKQMEVDEFNRREFCSILSAEDGTENSCARVDSVFITRTDGKSHMKVSRVVNVQGPQTQPQSHSTENKDTQDACKEGVNQALHERLDNMEKHLRINQDKKADSKDVYKRLRRLEERILFLESLSPEYFGVMPPTKMRKKKEGMQNVSRYSGGEELSTSEIDMKIKDLQHALQSRIT